MFGFAGADDDEDVSDNSSIPMKYQHFNPTGRPKSKLGRRRLMQTKNSKNEEAPKQDPAPLKNSHWSRDDSGIFPSNSTPSLTHPVSRTGNANFNAKLGAGTFTSTFTPSYKSNQENKFNKFALPSTPRFRNEPLKEINGVDGLANCVSRPANSMITPLSDPKPAMESAVQKQLNSSFISDESPPLGSSAANKTANETSDISNDSSFMTCHDIHAQQSNKTVYDPAFLKTPGRNLAEIRLDESPFNPLVNFLEESDDFGLKKTPLSAFKPHTELVAPNETVNVDVSCYGDPLAFPLDSSNVLGNEGDAIVKNLPKLPEKSTEVSNFNGSKGDAPRNNQDRASSGKRADDQFKLPSLALMKTPQPNRFNQKEDVREHATPSSGYISEKSFHSDDTTHATYPQPSKSVLGQKNTFTSQFSFKPGMASSVKVLSLGNQGYEPLSASSLQNSNGMSHFDQGYGAQNGRMVHRMGNVRDSRAEIDRPFLPAGTDVRRSTSPVFDSASLGSNGTVVAQNAKDTGGVQSHDDDTSTNHNNEATVVAKGSYIGHRPSHPEHGQQQGHNPQPVHKKPDSQPLNRPSADTYNSQVNDRQVALQPNKPNRPQYGGHQQSDQKRPQSDSQFQQPRSQSAGHQQPSGPHGDAQQPQHRPQSAGQQSESAGPPSGNSVLSALIKPQPQNVITIKGTPYTVLSLLGKGGSSQVYQALGPQSSKLMAIKCVNLASVEEAMATDYLNEIALLSKLQGCPSVIKMFDHEYEKESQMLYVVLEKGDIDFSKLIKTISETNQISMPMILYYWSEMLNAVDEIHKRGIIHSDLKPANFLLVEGRLKLIDFGIASSIQGDTTSVMKDVPAGTYNYMSPESITGPKITRKSDVWSMGCILFNLLYGRTPFSHLNNRWQKLHAIADVNHPVTFPPLKHHAPPSLRLALRWCLNKDPALRPTVEELVTLSELSPPPNSGLGKEIDGMMCQYFRRVLPNLRNLKEDSWEHPTK